MLAEFGCRYAIVGHSERRTRTGEGGPGRRRLRLRGRAGARAHPIVCVGETPEQREVGETAAVVKRQPSAVIHTLAHCVSEIVVAYEPVGHRHRPLSATPQQAQEVHELPLRAAAGGRGREVGISDPLTAAASSWTTRRCCSANRHRRRPGRRRVVEGRRFVAAVQAAGGLQAAIIFA